MSDPSTAAKAFARSLRGLWSVHLRVNTYHLMRRHRVRQDELVPMWTREDEINLARRVRAIVP